MDRTKDAPPTYIERLKNILKTEIGSQTLLVVHEKSCCLKFSLVFFFQLSQNNAEDVVKLTSFVNHACHFFECMYDPYFMWRKQLRGYVSLCMSVSM